MEELLNNANPKAGLLYNPADIKLHRQWFEETVKLRGIYVIYRSPKADKHYTTYAEIESNYEKPILVGCLFHDHPDQRTLKKMGWVSELDEEASLIEVPYDLPGLQEGALFIVPSGIDNAKGRLFRVRSMRNIMLFPASITCEIFPEFENTINPVTIKDFERTSMNFLHVDDEPQY